MAALAQRTLPLLNKTTGQATIIGPFDGLCTQSPCNLEGIEAIVFDTAGNLLGALSERGIMGTPGLYKINPTTGVRPFLHQFSMQMGRLRLAVWSASSSVAGSSLEELQGPFPQTRAPLPQTMVGDSSASILQPASLHLWVQ